MNICEVCDCDFEISIWHPKQKYCCRNCRENARHRIARGMCIKLSDIFCKVCDKAFKQKRANNCDYCSSLCKNLAATRKIQGLPVNGPKKHVKGSGYITTNGYKVISKKHVNSSKRGQILEHVYIMSNHLKRPIFEKETVHHKNGIRNDNRIENLELWSSSHPPGQRVSDKIEWCKQFLEQYGHTVIIK